MIAGRILFRLYSFDRRFLRERVLKIAKQMEGGECFSRTLRRIFKSYHGVEIGAYTMGGCFRPGAFDSNTRIGRYSSIARVVRSFNRDHPSSHKSTHALFFNPNLGITDRDTLERSSLEIGSDVWIGHNAIIPPHVRHIGDGAVIGAGAVLNKDVPPFAVVVGNPSRVVRYRFSRDIIDKLLAEKWWAKDLEELRAVWNEFQHPYAQEELDA